MFMETTLNICASPRKLLVWCRRKQGQEVQKAEASVAEVVEVQGVELWAEVVAVAEMARATMEAGDVVMVSSCAIVSWRDQLKLLCVVLCMLSVYFSLIYPYVVCVLCCLCIVL